MKCKNIKPSEKAKKLSDSGGLYLLVSPSGGKSWRLKYRFAGKEKKLSIGVYPTITLAEAREKRDEAKKQIVNGIDPSAAKQELKRQNILKSQNTFEKIALEWFEHQKEPWSVIIPIQFKDV